MAGKGGGAWKVAYADFVTAMMAFFMVMWITAQNDKIKQSIAHHFSDPYGADRRNGKSGGVDTNGAPFAVNNNNRLSIQPTILLDRNQKLLQLGMIVSFKGNSLEIDDHHRGQLDSLVPALKWKADQIQIIGFASKSPAEEGRPDPWTFAHQRCQVIKDFMEARGISTDKVRLSQRLETPEGTNSQSDPASGVRTSGQVEIRIPRKKDKAESQSGG